MTSKLNEHNVRFPRDKEGNIDVKTGKYDANNKPKKATFKYEQEVNFCIGAANIESKNWRSFACYRPIFTFNPDYTKA